MVDDVSVFIAEWRQVWVVKQSRHSRHGSEFWGRLADRLIEDRLPLDNNPLVPIGRYALRWAGAFEFLVERNNGGIALEQSGQIESALIVYELSIADEFTGTHPYDRLRIWYTKWEWYEDALRVCQSYLNKPMAQQSADTRQRFERHAQRIDDKQKRSRRKTHVQ